MIYHAKGPLKAVDAIWFAAHPGRETRTRVFWEAINRSPPPPGYSRFVMIRNQPGGACSLLAFMAPEDAQQEICGMSDSEANDFAATLRDPRSPSEGPTR